MFDKYEHLGSNLFMRYVNFRIERRSATDINNERYEGYMRSDFSVSPKKTIEVCDKMEIVRM
jgi:hypothetical protein